MWVGLLGFPLLPQCLRYNLNRKVCFSLKFLDLHVRKNKEKKIPSFVANNKKRMCQKQTAHVMVAKYQKPCTWHTSKRIVLSSCNTNLKIKVPIVWVFGVTSLIKTTTEYLRRGDVNRVQIQNQAVLRLRLSSKATPWKIRSSYTIFLANLMSLVHEWKNIQICFMQNWNLSEFYFIQ